jgi:hypothetical protein
LRSRIDFLRDWAEQLLARETLVAGDLDQVRATLGATVPRIVPEAASHTQEAA